MSTNARSSVTAIDVSLRGVLVRLGSWALLLTAAVALTLSGRALCRLAATVAAAREYNLDVAMAEGQLLIGTLGWGVVCLLTVVSVWNTYRRKGVG